MLRWHLRRGPIKRLFHALMVGMRTEDRRLNCADDLRISVPGLRFHHSLPGLGPDMAGARPATGAGKRLCRGRQIDAPSARAAKFNVKVARGSPDPDNRTLVILTAGPARFHPSKLQPIPDTENLWQGMNLRSGAVLGFQAMCDHPRNRT